MGISVLKLGRFLADWNKLAMKTECMGYKIFMWKYNKVSNKLDNLVITHESAVKMKAGATVICRINWAWRIYFYTHSYNSSWEASGSLMAIHRSLSTSSYEPFYRVSSVSSWYGSWITTRWLLYIER